MKVHRVEVPDEIVGRVEEWPKAELVQHSACGMDGRGRYQEIDVRIGPDAAVRIEPAGKARSLEQDASHSVACQFRDDFRRHRVD